MVVTVHLHSGPQRQTPEGRQGRLEVTLLSGSTLAELIPDLGVEASLGMLDMEVNGRAATADQILHDGDQVRFLPVG